MPIPKKQVIEFIQAMPEEDFADVDILPERIVLLSKIEIGEKNIAEGKTYTTEEAKEKLSKWLQ